MKRFCLTLDLIQNPDLIEEYKRHHQKVWPEVRRSILASGIAGMEIYLLGNRLVMVVDADESFSFERKARADAANPKVQEWEALMWQYQSALPQSRPGEKWLLMEKIFELKSPLSADNT